MVQSNTLPDDKLPQCWTDDVRMNALFAPFRLKSVNPESWDMKMKFWSDMVRQWCKFKMDPIVSASDIKCAFQRRGRTAACIDIVIEEMYRDGNLSPITKYQQILLNGPEGWVRWGARLAIKPAVIALTAVSYLLPARQALDHDGLPKASIESTQRFVLESAVKEQAMDLLDKYPVGAERIGTIEELMRITNWSSGREIFEILLGYLVSQGIAVKKGNVVKIADRNNKASPVTETDEAIVKLSSTEARLEADAERLAREVAAAHDDARAALKLGNKLAAKNHLRKRHTAQQKLDRCTTTLDNVRQLLAGARDAGSAAAVVDTYRTSAQALKRTMKEGGLQEDAVHDTMDELKEVMESYEEVERALGGALDDADVAALEDELRELLLAPAPPAAPGGERGADLRLPSPPAEQPTSEFVFDGEREMLDALEHLDEGEGDGERETAGTGARTPTTATETTPAPRKAEGDAPAPAPRSKLTSSMGPAGWVGAPTYGELRTDQRIHPGQPLSVDFSTPPHHYTTDFQVRDHRAAGGVAGSGGAGGAGVWLYNERDGARDEFSRSTEYTSSESPGKAGGGTWQMAPGGERKHQERWTHEHGAE